MRFPENIWERCKTTLQVIYAWFTALLTFLFENISRKRILFLCQQPWELITLTVTCAEFLECQLARGFNHSEVSLSLPMSSSFPLSFYHDSRRALYLCEVRGWASIMRECEPHAHQVKGRTEVFGLWFRCQEVAAEETQVMWSRVVLPCLGGRFELTYVKTGDSNQAALEEAATGANQGWVRWQRARPFWTRFSSFPGCSGSVTTQGSHSWSSKVTWLGAYLM